MTLLESLLKASTADIAKAFTHLQVSCLMDIADLAIAQVNDLRKSRDLSAYTLPSFQRGVGCK